MYTRPRSKPDRPDYKQNRQQMAEESAILAKATRGDLFKIDQPKKQEFSEPQSDPQIVISYPEIEHNVEQTPIPSFAGEVPKSTSDTGNRTGSWARNAIMAVALTAAAPALTDCALFRGYPAGTAYEIPTEVSRSEALKALKGKNYVVAWTYFRNKTIKEGDKDFEYYEAARKGAEAKSSYYLKNARSLVQGRYIEVRDYHQAIDDWKTAIAIRGANHPNNKVVEDEIEWAKKDLQRYEDEYKNQTEKMKGLIGQSEKLEDNIFDDIDDTIRRMIVLRIVLKKTDDSLFDLVYDLYSKFESSEEYIRAEEMASLAAHVKRGAYVKKDSALTEEHKDEFSDTALLANEQRKREKEERDRRKAELEPHIYKMEEVFIEGLKAKKKRYKKSARALFAKAKKMGQELLGKNPLPEHVTRINNIIYTRYGVKLSVLARWKSQKRTKVKQPASGVTPELTDDDKDDMNLSSDEQAHLAKETRAAQASADVGSAKELLQELNQIYKSDQENAHYDAIVQLDQAIRSFSGADPKARKLLLGQKNAWGPTRQSLISSYLNDAEVKPLSSKSYKLYEKVRTLEPGHKQAKERMAARDRAMKNFENDNGK